MDYKSFDDKFYGSFGLVDANGKLTNAGALIADDCPIRQSRVFCTRWNGLTKAGGLMDALDSAEYTGSLITLLEEGARFIRRNMRLMWRKTSTSRIEYPDYAERSYFEALTNALVHRSYLELGSEVHVDIFDDRLEISSPGGMMDGSKVQDLDYTDLISRRRNPVIADVFSRLGYMERQGSGLSKIIEGYEAQPSYTEDKKPEFFSNSSVFIVRLKNLNYGVEIPCDPKKPALEGEKTGLSTEKPALENEKTGLYIKNKTLQHCLIP